MARVDIDLLGLQVVSRADAAILGEVDALIVDDSGLRVAGFLVDMGVYEASVLSFDQALAIGNEAVIVESAASLTRISANKKLEELALKNITITDATAITVSGKSVGVLGDYYVDTHSGDIVGVEFIPSDVSVYPQEPAIVPVASIERLGVDIAVLKDDYQRHLLRDDASLEWLSPGPEPVEVEPAGAEPPVEPAEPEPLFIPEAQAAASPTEPATPPVQAAGGAGDSQVAEPVSGPQPKHFLIGKKVLRRIEDPQGTLVAEAGDLVDYDMIRRAKESDTLLILSLNVE